MTINDFLFWAEYFVIAETRLFGCLCFFLFLQVECGSIHESKYRTAVQMLTQNNCHRFIDEPRFLECHFGHGFVLTCRIEDYPGSKHGTELSTRIMDHYVENAAAWSAFQESRQHQDVSMISTNQKVLVTGASGYIATHIVRILLEEGYRVRGTVRSLTNEVKVNPLRELSEKAKHPLELVEANLLVPESWDKAVSGCEYVIHTAMIFPKEAPRDENEIIRPAVEGTLSVLAACRKHHVKRVVMTSSVAAIIGDPYSKNIPHHIYTEADWTDAKTAKDAYFKSKTLAEHAAWDFVSKLEGGERLELAIINPELAFGPTICGGDDHTSYLTIRKLMNREFPLVPELNFGIADVRDIALAHVRAMTIPEAAGHRHIICGGNMWYRDIAKLLQLEFEVQGYNIPTKHCPYFFMWLNGLTDKSVKMVLPLYNKKQLVDNTRMKTVLHITPTDMKKTILDMAYTLINKGVVHKKGECRSGTTIEEH